MSKTKKVALHTKILIGMVVGIIAGLIVKQLGLEPSTLETITAWVEPVGQIFLRLVFMTVIPLVFAALVMGIAEIGDLKRVGRIRCAITGLQLNCELNLCFHRCDPS